MFLGKRYLFDDLFKINVMTIVTTNENKNKNSSSFYFLESCNVFHDRLDHVNYNSIQRLIKP
jgi:hypothetical protein